MGGEVTPTSTPEAVVPDDGTPSVTVESLRYANASLLIDLLSGWRVVETSRAYLGQRNPRRRWRYATDAKFDIPDVPLIATYVRGADPRVDDRDLPQPGSAAAWAHQPSLSPVRTARSIP